MSKLTRRDFMRNTALAGAGLTIVPSSVVSGLGHKAPSDKLNIAGIGVGGMGAANLKQLESENIVALCDVDWKYAAKTFDRYPKAKRFMDFRKMYDTISNEIDAVVIATADHTHCISAAHAMTLGKHVYVQKPLTHSVYESRLLTKLAAKHKVATSMGNQGSSGDGVSLVCEWIANGEIGEVTKVETFTDRPIWPQGLNTPESSTYYDVSKLNWDLFVGPAKMRPFNEIYHPWNWRGWWDYGTGALGDMACHILHPVFVGLELGYPSKVQGSSTLLLNDCAPSAQQVKLIFPERKPSKNMKINLPEVEVTWSDGGIKPFLPEGWPSGKDPNNEGGYVCFHGTKDKIICGCYGREPWLISGKTPKSPEFRRRIKTSHEMDWVRACKESATNRTETASPFSEAGPFNEMVVMGVLAVRLQALNKELEWDGENMKFTNISSSEEIKTCVKDGFHITDGDPSFDKTWTKPISATEYANELIKHTYRQGWELPPMP
ncbi:MAG: Gfo/Idh/MocA family protein [Bacteroidales bacterium]